MPAADESFIAEVAAAHYARKDLKKPRHIAKGARGRQHLLAAHNIWLRLCVLRLPFLGTDLDIGYDLIEVVVEGVE
jgi:hypothetical protein